MYAKMDEEATKAVYEPKASLLPLRTSSIPLLHHLRPRPPFPLPSHLQQLNRILLEALCCQSAPTRSINIFYTWMNGVERTELNKPFGVPSRHEDDTRLTT